MTDSSSRYLWTGIGLAAASALAYAFVPLFAKTAYRLGSTPMEFVSLRFLFSIPFFWAFSLAFRRGRLKIGWEKGAFCVVAGFLFGLAAAAIFKAFQLIDATLAIILLYTYPPLIGMWGRLILKEKLGPIRILSLGVTFAGVALTAGTPAAMAEKEVMFGMILALTAAFCYSLYSLIAQKITASTGPLAFTTYSVTASFVLISFAQAPLPVLLRSPGPVIILGAAAALISTFLGIYLYAVSIHLIGAGRASIVSNLEPVAVAGLAFIFLGERLAPIQILGGVLILGGVYLLRLERAAKQPS